ncbi:MAG: response regulator [Burkholderiaceae bacterium]|nr:response regulator [Burkholderiaceae bacterium]
MNDSYILIVEDETSIRELIAFACVSAGFTVKGCENTQKAQALLEEQRPSLILLDYMLPDKSGVQWLEELRQAPETVTLPVIMLTARGSEADRVNGLNAGADDYIVKPFMPRELTARINAVLRRARVLAPTPNPEPLVRCGPLEMDEKRCEARVDGQTLTLSAKEFKLLLVFAKNPGRVYSREMLLELVWDNAYIDERTVDVHMLRLRKQLQGTACENLLQTVRGLGYRANVV